MKKETKNLGHSARARLLAIANRHGVQLEYVLLRYAFERFLYRLGRSRHVNRFVLKGASAFAVWNGPFCRVTRDADLEVFGDASELSLVGAFKEICEIPCPEDGVDFDLASFDTTEIKKEDKYPGLRVKFAAHIGSARVNLQCDIGFGDSVYPAAEILDYPVLLGGETPRVRVYPRYTVVSDKFQIMVSRGLLNSRLKDYYDIWLLSECFDFDLSLLRTAVENTFERRKTAVPKGLPNALTPTFSEDPAKQLQWRAFLRRSGLAQTSLSAVVEQIAELIKPVLQCDMPSQTWKCAVKRWECV